VKLAGIRLGAKLFFSVKDKRESREQTEITEQTEEDELFSYPYLFDSVCSVPKMSDKPAAKGIDTNRPQCFSGRFIGLSRRAGRPAVSRLVTASGKLA
jgi:hypothetical protein